MTEQELKVLLDAAQLAKIPAADLKPVNPFTQNGARAKTMQMAVQTVSPQMAAKFRFEAGDVVSLAAAAAKAGITEMNQAVHQELNELDADYITGQQEASSRREAELLASMEKGAADLASARERQQQVFARQSTAGTGQHNRDFLRRMGVQNAAQLNNIPARRVVGK